MVVRLQVPGVQMRPSVTGPSYRSIFAGLHLRGVPVSYSSGQEQQQERSRMRLYLLLLVLLSLLTSYNMAQDVEAPHSSSVLSYGVVYLYCVRVKTHAIDPPLVLVLLRGRSCPQPIEYR